MRPSCVFISLQYFNTRTCQLVLGAGAVDVVGLKTITARHLGQCSHQNLQAKGCKYYLMTTPFILIVNTKQKHFS